MAEFCKQCSKELFGQDTNDMSGRVTKEQYEDGYVGTGLCEGCSGGEFTPDGTCLGGCEIHERIEEGG